MFFFTLLLATTVPKFSVPTDEFHVEPWVFQVAEIVIFSQFCLRSPTLSGTISSIVPLRTDVDPRSGVPLTRCGLNLSALLSSPGKARFTPRLPA